MLRRHICQTWGSDFAVIYRWEGDLRNDDGGGNENSKKAIGLDKQNNNYARASQFLYISFLSLHNYSTKLPTFTFFGGREHEKMTFFFPWTWIQLFRIQLQTNSPTFWNWWRWNKLDKIWSTTDLLFMWRFGSHLRRRCCCLSSPMHPLTLSSVMNMQAYALVLCSILRGGGGEGEGNIQVISVTFLTCLLRLTSATSRHASIITCLSWGSITSSIMLLISESSWDCCIASKTYSTSFGLN